MSVSKDLSTTAEKGVAGKRHRSEAMGRDPIWGLLFRFSGPAVVSQLVNASYNLVDAIFVGRLGTVALAGLAVSNPLMAIYRSIGMGIGVGSASLIARRLGEGSKTGVSGREGADRAAAGAMTLFLMVSAAMTTVCLLSLNFLLGLFGAKGEVLALGRSYMLVETSFIFLDFFLMVLVELVRVEGNPVLASVAQATSGIMNCIWDPILGFGWGPFPRMGIAGFALATSVGRTIGAAILLVYLFSSKSSYRFKLKYFIPNFKLALEIYRVGASMTVRMIGGSISQMIASRTAASFGTLPLAVVGVQFRALGFAVAPCMGIGQGMLPLVGYNHAAGNKKRTAETVVKAVTIILLYSLACWVGIRFFATNIMSLFNSNPDFLAVAGPAFLLFSLVFFAAAVQTALGFFFQGIGKALPALIVSSSRQLIFLVPALLIMPRLLGLSGLYAAYPVADALSVTLSIIWLSSEFKQQKIPFSLRYLLSSKSEG